MSRLSALLVGGEWARAIQFVKQEGVEGCGGRRGGTGTRDGDEEKAEVELGSMISSFDAKLRSLVADFEEVMGVSAEDFVKEHEPLESEFRCALLDADAQINRRLVLDKIVSTRDLIFTEQGAASDLISSREGHLWSDVRNNQANVREDGEETKFKAASEAKPSRTILRMLMTRLHGRFLSAALFNSILDVLAEAVKENLVPTRVEAEMKKFLPEVAGCQWQLRAAGSQLGTGTALRVGQSRFMTPWWHWDGGRGDPPGKVHYRAVITLAGVGATSYIPKSVLTSKAFLTSWEEFRARGRHGGSDSESSLDGVANGEYLHGLWVNQVQNRQQCPSSVPEYEFLERFSENGSCLLFAAGENVDFRLLHRSPWTEDVRAVLLVQWDLVQQQHGTDIY